MFASPTSVATVRASSGLRPAIRDGQYPSVSATGQGKTAASQH